MRTASLSIKAKETPRNAERSSRKAFSFAIPSNSSFTGRDAANQFPELRLSEVFPRAPIRRLRSSRNFAHGETLPLTIVHRNEDNTLIVQYTELKMPLE